MDADYRQPGVGIARVPLLHVRSVLIESGVAEIPELDQHGMAGLVGHQQRIGVDPGQVVRELGREDRVVRGGRIGGRW